MTLNRDILHLLLLTIIHTAADPKIEYIKALQESGVVLRVPEYTGYFGNGTLPGLRIPLDLSVNTDSSSDHCIPTNGPYCYAVGNGSNVVGQLGGCYKEVPSALCEQKDNRGCAEGDSTSIESYKTPFSFISIATNVAYTSIPACGLVVKTNSLQFTNPTQACDDSEILQPSLELSEHDNFDGYTLFFTYESTNYDTE